MKRREFLKSTYKFTALVGAGYILGNLNDLLLAQETNYDLIAIKGGEPDTMFDVGIEAFGGIKRFINKGQKVVIKPNIGWDTTPERAANTNPKLIARIIEHCYNAGAKEVYVLDHTCDEWQRCYKNSGIEKAAKDTKAKVVPANSESYYQEVNIPQGKVLKKTKEHEIILSSDVFINVPILKNHSGTTLTIAMKNLMGNVWDRRYWHRNDLHQCIADFASYRNPTLNIVDAYLVMKTNGPRGVSTDDVTLMKSQLIATDIVAIDTAATKLFGLNPNDIKYINIAAEMKIGRKDIENLNIKRITI